MMRRVRHISDADEVRGAKPQPSSDDELEARGGSIEQRFQPAVIAIGAGALIVLIFWLLAG